MATKKKKTNKGRKPIACKVLDKHTGKTYWCKSLTEARKIKRELLKRHPNDRNVYIITL